MKARWFLIGTVAACIALRSISWAQSASIPLHLNSGIKAGFNLVVRVGGGPARPVIFDTGSAGLWIYPDAIGTYTPTQYQVTQSYPSGITYEATVVYTTVDFGNGLKTASIPVALVREAACSAQRPHCAAEAGSRACPTIRPGTPNAGIACLEEGRKLYGHFGAAPWTIGIPRGSREPHTELYDPLLGIAQPWAASFVVTPTAIAFAPSPSGFTLIPMPRATSLPEAIPSGAVGWGRGVSICYTIGARVRNQCVASIFDTGATNIVLQGDFDLALGPGRCGRQVVAGTRFVAQLPNGTPIADFTTGTTPNWDIVRTGMGTLQPALGGFVNTGLTFFNRDEILFDLKNGYIGLRALATPASTAQGQCGGG
jgi:hypothetical protein